MNEQINLINSVTFLVIIYLFVNSVINAKLLIEIYYVLCFMLVDGDTWMDGLAPFLRNTLSSDEIERETFTQCGKLFQQRYKGRSRCGGRWEIACGNCSGELTFDLILKRKKK